MSNAGNVTAVSPDSTSGGLSFAPIGTALPTDATSSLAAAFMPFGYISEDGLRDAGEGASYNDIKAWGGDNVASVLESKRTIKKDLTLLEVLNATVLGEVYGQGNVTTTPATVSSGTKITVLDKGDEIPRRVYVVDGTYGGKRIRDVYPNVQPTLTGEGDMVHNALYNFAMSFTAYPDSSGVSRYRYIVNDDVLAS